MAILDDLIRLQFGTPLREAVQDIAGAAHTGRIMREGEPLVSQFGEDVRQADSPMAIYDLLGQTIEQIYGMDPLGRTTLQQQAMSLAELALGRDDAAETVRQRERAARQFEMQEELHEPSLGQAMAQLNMIERELGDYETQAQRDHLMRQHQVFIEMLRGQIQERLQISMARHQREGTFEQLMAQARFGLWNALQANPMTSQYLNQLPPDKDVFDYLNPARMDLDGMARDIAMQEDVYEPVLTQRTQEIYSQLLRAVAPTVQAMTMEDWNRLLQRYNEYRGSLLNPEDAMSFQQWQRSVFGSGTHDPLGITDGEIDPQAADRIDREGGATGIGRRTRPPGPPSTLRTIVAGTTTKQWVSENPDQARQWLESMEAKEDLTESERRDVNRVIRALQELEQQEGQTLHTEE